MEPNSPSISWLSPHPLIKLGVPHLDCGTCPSSYLLGQAAGAQDKGKCSSQLVCWSHMHFQHQMFRGVCSVAHTHLTTAPQRHGLTDRLLWRECELRFGIFLITVVNCVYCSLQMVSQSRLSVFAVSSLFAFTNRSTARVSS